MDVKNLMVIILSLIYINHEQNIIEGKQFTRCQLFKELEKYKFQRTFMSNWICLIENESNRDTKTFKQYPNLSSGYGLFQINNKTGCRSGRKAGLCEKKCEDFLDDNLNDDVVCAQLLWNQFGFKSWNGWMRKCRGRKLPDVFNC